MINLTIVENAHITAFFVPPFNAFQALPAKQSLKRVLLSLQSLNVALRPKSMPARETQKKILLFESMKTSIKTTKN